MRMTVELPKELVSAAKAAGARLEKVDQRPYPVSAMLRRGLVLATKEAMALADEADPRSKPSPEAEPDPFTRLI